MATETIKAAISGVSKSAGTLTDMNNGIVGKDSSNLNSYTKLSFSRNVTTYLYLSFDLSSIPAGAEIDSVTCNVRFAINHSSTVAFAALYAGSTKKTGDTRMSATTVTLYTFSGGAWTRDELLSCRLGISCSSSNTTSSNRTVQTYGADLTVTYTYQSEKFMLKLSGDYEDVARTFKKVSGIWVEQTDLANVIEDGVRYQNGGEIVIPKPAAVTIVGTGNVTYCYAVINGTKYSEATSGVEVYTGDVITFGYFGLPQDGNLGYVAVDGTNLSESTSGVKTVDWVVPSGVQTINISFNYNSGNYSRITITTGGGSSANLISFTIAGTSYQAEEGMTWGEWVASSYNPGLFKIYEFVGFGTYVQNTNDRTVCTTDGAPVAVDSPIQNGYGYITTT